MEAKWITLVIFDWLPLDHIYILLFIGSFS